MLVTTIALRGFNYLDFAYLSNSITACTPFCRIARRGITLTTYLEWYYSLRY